MSQNLEVKLIQLMLELAKANKLNQKIVKVLTCNFNVDCENLAKINKIPY